MAEPFAACRTVTAALAAVAVLAACGEPVPAIDTGDAERALDAVVERAGFPDAGTFVELDRCPIVDVDQLLGQVFGDLDRAVESALAAPTQAFVSAPNEQPGGDPYLGCGRLDRETGTGVLLVVADAPGEGLVDPDAAPDDLDVGTQWETIVDGYAARFGDLASSLDTRRIRDTRGGTMYRICIAEPDVPERDSCEAAWFGGDLVVSAMVTGPGSLDADIAALEESFRRRLQLVVDGLTDS